jgi:hypothetical protein
MPAFLLVPAPTANIAIRSNLKIILLGPAFSMISRLFAHTTHTRSDFSQGRRSISALRWRA